MLKTKRKRRKNKKYDFLYCDLVYSSNILMLNNYVAKREHHVSESCGDNEDYSQLSSSIINGVFEPSYGTFMLLFSFTDNYINSAMELIAATNKTGLNVLYKDIYIEKGKFKKQSLYTKDGIVKKFDRSNTHVNYILIGGSPNDYINLYKNIDNLSNDLLLEISANILTYMNKSLFLELINDNIFSINSFADWALNPGTIEDCLHGCTSIILQDDDLCDDNIGIVDYDLIDCIMKQLPDAFSTLDLPKFINITFEITNQFSDNIHIFNMSLYDLLYYYESPTNLDKAMCKLINDNKLFYDNLIKGQYVIEGMIEQILAPIYKRTDEDVIFGKMDNNDVDEDFMNQFNQRITFNPVMNNEEDYINIDEELSEDDPEYNNLQKEKEN